MEGIEIKEVLEKVTTLETRLVHLGEVKEYIDFKKFYASLNKESNQSDSIHPES